jgi:hypothetical protein
VVTGGSQGSESRLPPTKCVRDWRTRHRDPWAASAAPPRTAGPRRGHRARRLHSEGLFDRRWPKRVFPLLPSRDVLRNRCRPDAHGRGAPRKNHPGMRGGPQPRAGADDPRRSLRRESSQTSRSGGRGGRPSRSGAASIMARAAAWWRCLAAGLDKSPSAALRSNCRETPRSCRHRRR